ncbi:anti-sigma factor family protein [Anaerobacillus isosaccharinicus]|uniref:Anti-sigma-W factor RsiW n=1 Tax=Anaerobacillus isosaccharinicus TaxID=1532552 RepID=A0A1S2L951_9BACI|nr:zf-HC2 domain-containing protein [Anaerobacillus isosaccharinicus]MBA5584007.1 zf-HC2 domain-containing protein [Anaerobacillus isosaccharinicus]QOY37577.1 zf-HC2 domain-containing protein [Anaerobacillus isosaccharinicus]
MNCDKEVFSLIHKYLDEEITDLERRQLNNHLVECENCRAHMSQLKKSIAIVQSTSHIEAPPNFTNLVISQLPQQKSSVNWKRWMKNHPVLIAASIFFLFMATSMFSIWMDTGKELSVSGQANLIIDKERNVVVVPKGEVVQGDLLIKNGSIQVDGQVNGNITVINGQKYTASAGQVVGNIEEIDKGLQWVWYSIKSFFFEVVNIFDEREKK